MSVCRRPMLIVEYHLAHRTPVLRGAAFDSRPLLALGPKADTNNQISRNRHSIVVAVALRSARYRANERRPVYAQISKSAHRLRPRFSMRLRGRVLLSNCC